MHRFKKNTAMSSFRKHCRAARRATRYTDFLQFKMRWGCPQAPGVWYCEKMPSIAGHPRNSIVREKEPSVTPIKDPSCSACVKSCKESFDDELIWHPSHIVGACFVSCWNQGSSGFSPGISNSPGDYPGYSPGDLQPLEYDLEQLFPLQVVFILGADQHDLE